MNIQPEIWKWTLQQVVIDDPPPEPPATGGQVLIGQSSHKTDLCGCLCFLCIWLGLSVYAIYSFTRDQDTNGIVIWAVILSLVSCCALAVLLTVVYKWNKKRRY